MESFAPLLRHPFEQIEWSRFSMGAPMRRGGSRAGSLDSLGAEACRPAAPVRWSQVSDPFARASQTSQTEYLSIDDVVQIVEMFSEAPLREAVRDLGLLIGAVDRPALKYRGMDVYTPLAMKAAAFMESLARNNALFDGNKRLAWLATNVFLELNGATVHFSDNEIFSLLREVQQGYLATNELAHRLHTRIGPAAGQD